MVQEESTEYLKEILPKLSPPLIIPSPVGGGKASSILKGL